MGPRTCRAGRQFLLRFAQMAHVGDRQYRRTSRPSSLRAHTVLSIAAHIKSASGAKIRRTPDFCAEFEMRQTRTLE